MEPQVAPAHYFKEKYVDLNRFISYFYQIDLALDCLRRGGGELLEIGIGNATVSTYLRRAGVPLVTCDVDGNLNPDHVADVRSLPFPAERFYAVMACEVLEHLPFDDFERALAELARVSREFVIISLPYRSTGFEVVLKFPFLRTLFSRSLFDVFLRIPLIFRRAGPRGQHHWEIDLFRYPLRRIRAILRRHFAIEREVRPVLQGYHYFFVLRKLP